MKAPSLLSTYIPKSLVGFSRGLVALSLVGSLTLGTSQAQAADGTWIQNASGNWNNATTGPWLNDIVASGANSNAFFNTIDLTANATVTLTENFTIGNLYFGDTGTSTLFNWTLSRTGSAALTLQTSSGAPTISTATGTTTINAALAGTQGFTKTGSGTLVLSGTNSLTGGITVNAGTLDIRTTGSIGSNSISLAAGTILDAANSATGSSITISGNITGDGRINKTSSTSTLVLTGNNSFTGGTTLGAGIIAVGSGLNNGIGSGTLTLNGGALISTDNTARTFINAIALGSNNLRLGGIQGESTNLGNLNFTWNGTTTIGGSKDLTVNNNTRVTFANSWTGNNNVVITKRGTGTLVFDGNMTGSTSVGVTVSAGTLILNGSKTTSGAVTVETGGTLGGNSPSMAGVFTLNTGGAISPGDGGIGTLTATNLTWNGETSGAFAQMKFELGNVPNLGIAATSDKLSLGTGILTKGSGTTFTFDFLGTGATGDTYTLLTFGSTTFSASDFSYTNLAGGLTGTFSLEANSLLFTVVPEPSTYALLAVGLMAVVFFRRKKSSAL